MSIDGGGLISPIIGFASSGSEPGPSGPVPDAVNGLVALRADGQVSLDWLVPNDNGSPITGYRIERGESGTYSTIATAADSLYVDTTAVNGTTYDYRAYAINANGESLVSNEYQATPLSGAKIVVFSADGQSNSICRAPFDGGQDWPANAYQAGRDARTPYSDNPNNSIVPAVRPLDHANQFADNYFGWTLQFTLDYLADNPAHTIIWIPGGRSATAFSKNHWNPGNTWYNSAVIRATYILDRHPEFEYAGGLWHQGESDTGMTQAAYASALDAMIQGRRAAVSLPDLPWILGRLASNRSGTTPDLAIVDTPNRLANTAYIEAADLSTQDGTHFTAASYRTMGTRYYQAWVSVAVPVPEEVLDLLATPGDGRNVLSWTAPADGGSPITGYRIERRAGGAFSTLTTVANTQYADETALNGTAYDYRVFAINANGEGASSNVDTATPVAATPEAGSTHWHFGDDYPTYLDLSGTSSLTAVNTAPTLDTAWAGWNNTRNKGLMSSIPDVYPLTYCIVAKRYNVSGNVILCGNSEPNVAGRMLFLTRGGELRHRFDPGANVEAMGGAGSNSNFVFFAAAIEEVNATQARLRMYAGRSAGAITREVVITKKILNGTIGIADSNGWDNTAVDSRLETSEFIVFESNAKTFSELDDVYARSVNRMAARGLTLI